MLTRTALKSFIALAFSGVFLIASWQSTQTATAQQTLPPSLPATPEGLEFFEKKIRPVLAESCYGCHSAKARKPQGGLLLDSIDAMIKGGASGEPAIVPGQPEKSLLIKAISYTDPKLQMPFGGKLPDQVVKDFEQWVKMGAPTPRESAATAARTSDDFSEAKKFWSFQPVKDSAPPRVKNQTWIKTPIDQFILAKLAEKSLKPIADADKRTLIRRATFDLTGLPPTPDEIEAFLKDSSPNAFEKVVDRLLASPAYGEKWGRRWLDVVRYADTAGDNSDYPVTAAYRYRSYVIDSFNKDKPYNQFIREQIAGDILAKHLSPRIDDKLPEEEEDEVEIPGAKKMTADELEKSRQEKIIATGYLAMSRRFGSRNKEMNLTIDDTIDNLGKAFLGLSVSCARCHDHKFDPIPQQDYYALYGVFNSSRYSFPGAEIYKHPAEMVSLVSGKDAEKFYKQQKELTELDDRNEFLTAERGTAARNKKMKEQQAKEMAENAAKAGDRNNESGAQSNKLAGKSDQKKTEPQDEIKPADFDRDADNWGRAGQSKRMPEEVDAEMKQVKARFYELHASYSTAPKAYAVVEGAPQNVRIHRKGDPKNMGEVAPRGFLTILGGQKVPADYKGSGRDLLADWIAEPNNPLTARVMVNRIWQSHFGKGLVQTPNDFGARGKTPTHPELLDYLAARFIESGWSIKRMHRLMMRSRVYQLASADDAKNSAIDVNNDYLWRFERRRLDAEEIRDAILAVGGTLDRQPGGAHPFPAENTWKFTQHVQFFATYETNKRSVYIMQQRLKKHPFFEVFDGADQNAITGQRAQSITPVQALFLMNNPMMHEQADQLAVRVVMAYDVLPERIDYAYRLALGRPAKPEELKEAQAYLLEVKRNLQAVKTPEEKLNRLAFGSFCRVLLSCNEFLYVE